MICKDFREIADSYLSDELAVETNHEIFQHLENCPGCRHELALRREVREKVRYSLKNAPDFQINPAFATRLERNLKNEALINNSWLNWKILTPVFAGILLILGLSLTFLYHPDFAGDLAKKAVERHEDCGLKHLAQWEQKSNSLPMGKKAFVKSLESSNTRILEAHDCEFEGKLFTHYILERNGKTISVLKTASENAAPTNIKTADSIISEHEDGFQISRFSIGNDAVLVISNLNEAENLNLARTLFDAVKS